MLEFKPAIMPRQTDGWLSPEGLFYACGYGFHAYCARALLGENHPTENAVHYLETHGWVHISGHEIVNQFIRLTQAQQNILFDIAMLNPKSGMGRSLLEDLGMED